MRQLPDQIISWLTPSIARDTTHSNALWLRWVTRNLTLSRYLFPLPIIPPRYYIPTYLDIPASDYSLPPPDMNPRLSLHRKHDILNWRVSNDHLWHAEIRKLLPRSQGQDSQEKRLVTFTEAHEWRSQWMVTGRKDKWHLHTLCFKPRSCRTCLAKTLITARFGMMTVIMRSTVNEWRERGRRHPFPRITFNTEEEGQVRETNCGLVGGYSYFLFSSSH